jgi:hypothetical protein
MSQESRSHSSAPAAVSTSSWTWRLPTSLVLLMFTMPVLLLAALITLPFILLGGSHVGAASPADLLRLYLQRLPL